MKNLKYLLSGIFFGIVMVKSEAASWYRIQEMFRFQSWHMYGIIGSAVTIGAIAIFLIKRNQLVSGPVQEAVFADKRGGWKNYLYGGIIFGLGWALVGACPGPLFVNLGLGYLTMILPILGALAGTFLYGLIKDRLPH